MRVPLTIGAALLIMWQSSCLTFENGALLNRCGLWQKFSGGAIIIATRPAQLKPIASKSIDMQTVISTAQPIITIAPVEPRITVSTSATTALNVPIYTQAPSVTGVTMSFPRHFTTSVTASMGMPGEYYQTQGGWHYYERR